jgi:hypothetical protein
MGTKVDTVKMLPTMVEVAVTVTTLPETVAVSVLVLYTKSAQQRNIGSSEAEHTREAQ